MSEGSQAAPGGQAGFSAKNWRVMTPLKSVCMPSGSEIAMHSDVSPW